jgi:hypothetical protein
MPVIRSSVPQQTEHYAREVRRGLLRYVVANSINNYPGDRACKVAQSLMIIRLSLPI